MALFDLMGKALDVPAYRLLGGKYRDLVPVSRCSGRMTPEHAAETAQEAVAQGYSVLKMKATADDASSTAWKRSRMPSATSSRSSSIPISASTTRPRCSRGPKSCGAGGSPMCSASRVPSTRPISTGTCWRASKMSTPIALHLEEPSEIREAIKREACDWLNIGGPMVNCYKTAAMCEAAGIPTWHGSGVDLGIAEAAHAHVAAACKSMTLTSDICGETLRVDDLIAEPLVIENGHVRVPEGPGLGVALDEDALDRYRVRE